MLLTAHLRQDTRFLRYTQRGPTKEEANGNRDQFRSQLQVPFLVRDIDKMTRTTLENQVRCQGRVKVDE